jgi:hypothetical protein
MEKYAISSPPENAYPSQPSNPSFISQPVDVSTPAYQPQYQQNPYSNTDPAIQHLQPTSARLESPPNDYLAWSITNSVCAVLFSIWA